ncbi:MAG: CHAT domain-containing protein [Bacteroidetes bacterium]|nr:CHAT domain-containing protein [Bacteroidota bacterium]
MKRLLFFIIGSLLAIHPCMLKAQKVNEVQKLLVSVDSLIGKGQRVKAEELLSPFVELLKPDALENPTLLHYNVWKRWNEVTFDWFHNHKEYHHEASMEAPQELIQITENLQPFDLYRYTDSWLELLLKAIRSNDANVMETGFRKVDSLMQMVKKDQTLRQKERSSLEARYLQAKQMGRYFEGEPQSALQFSKEIIAIYEKWDDSVHFNLVRTYLMQGVSLCALSQFDEAIGSFQQAAQFAQILYGENYIGRGYMYDWTGYAYYFTHRYDQAIPHLETAISIIQEHYPEPVPHLELLYARVADSYYFTGECEEAILLYERYIDLLKSLYGEQSSKLQPAYHQIANCYQFLFQYKEAIKNFKISASIARANDGDLSTTLAQLYYLIGDVYAVMGKFTQTVHFFELATAIYESYGEGHSHELAEIYSKTGAAHTRLEEHEKAIIYLKRAIFTFAKEQKKNNWSFNTDLALVYKDLSEVYKELGELDSSFVYIQKGLQSVHPLDHNPRYFIFSQIGAVYSAKGQYQLALEAQFQTLKELTAFDPKRENVNLLASTYQEIGDCYFYLEKYTQSISYLEKARQLSENSDSEHNIISIATSLGKTYTATRELEKALEIFKGIYSRFAHQIQNSRESNTRTFDILMHMLFDYSSTLFKKYQRDKTIGDLRQAYQYSQQSLDIFQYVRQHLPEEQTREHWINKHNSMFEIDLMLAHELYQSSRDPSYIDKALKTMEITKSFNLLSALRTEQAANFARVPFSLLEEEDSLKLELQILKNKLSSPRYQSQASARSSAELDSFIFETQRNYEQFLKNLEKNYANYFHLKYRSNTATISDIQQNMLREGEVLIQFTLIEEPEAHIGISDQPILYTLAISRNAVFLRQTLPGENFPKDLQSYLEYLSSYQPLDSTQGELGQNMYNLLLKEPLQAFTNQPQKLIIIPDGKLNYLPFEVLPVPDAPKEVPWLIYHLTCSYAYSATLLQEQLRIKSKSSHHFFAGFASDYSQFGQNKDTMSTDPIPLAMARNVIISPLPHARKEVETIAELMGGISFLGKQATEKSFKENAPDYQILHLALHTFFNDREPLQSDLVFTPVNDSTEDGFLTVSEIYNLDLSAELAVLSACNTGYGAFQPGEGVKSLSRAMSYVGVPATVMSLWKVPDHSTSELMLSFYTYLREGLNKDEALRKAKLDYLSRSVEGDQKLPIYWAGFIASGDMAPINLPDQWIWVWGSLLILLVVAGGVFFYKSFAKSSALSR